MVVGGRPDLMLAQVQVLGPFGPDLGPDLDLTWDLDLSLTILNLIILQKTVLSRTSSIEIVKSKTLLLQKTEEVKVSGQMRPEFNE